MNTILEQTTENKLEEVKKSRKRPPKHKIGGYITEQLYQDVHEVCEMKDISISDLFQALLSEYVFSFKESNFLG